MRFFKAYVRGTIAGAVPDQAVEDLAQVLVRKPEEVLLTAQGARNGHGPLADGRPAAAALARRNIRSLLARSTNPVEVAAALKVALTAPAREAEDMLEDTRLEFNLRYSLFLTPDATIRLENDELVIADANAPTMRIPRTELREKGTRHFGPEALARLVSMPITAVRFSETAIQPLGLQREPGAVMEPDTAHQRLHKGEWRATRVPRFEKEFCITCARCFVHCPDNAIIHAMFDKSTQDTTGILGIDYDRCTACGICSSVCPTNRDGYKAIVMVEADAETNREVHHVA